MITLLNGVSIQTENELYHYGTPRHSGRYPWGSGDRPYQGDKPYSKLLKQNIKSGKDKANVSPLEKATKTGVSLTTGAQDTVRSLKKFSKLLTTKEQRDFSNMSDQELKNVIGRIRLESDLNSLLSQSESSNTFDYITAVVDVLGGITVTAAAVATIAATIYNIKD